MMRAGLVCALVAGVLSSARANPPKLVIVDDEGKQTVVPLIRDEISIGRVEGNMIRLTERDVSQRHARLLRRGDTFAVEDLHSDNGTRVNGVNIHEVVELDERALVEIGAYQLFLTTLPAHVGGFPAPRAASFSRPLRLAKSALPPSPPVTRKSNKPFKVAYAAKTEIGRGRSLNADYFSINENEVLFIVANGPDDEPGAAASKAAADVIEAFYQRTRDENATWAYAMDRRLGYVENRLLCALRVAHDTAGAKVGVGAAVLDGQALVVAQIGKAPAYRIRGGKIERLVPAATAPDEIHVRSHAVIEDDIVLLGSVGFAASLSDSAILATVQRAGHNMEDAAKQLIELALAKGTENVTVTLMRFHTKPK